jgi:N,N-dimethylformamidase beta subunit-like protein/uncharacterized protein DUF4082/Big-like domain-containing protein
MTRRRLSISSLLRAAGVAALLVFSGTARTTGPNASAQVSGCLSNAVVCENQNTGAPSSEWDITGSGDASIQGFATEMSVNRGGTVHFKVQTNASSYQIAIYRMGYYGGLGARRIATIAPSAALPQTQPPCLTETATGLVDCGNWAESASWDVPATAASGIYFAKLTRTGTGGASHIVFVVRDDAGKSDLLFQTSDSTWQAYNRYGGKSLYTGGPATSPNRAYKVSYNRPLTTRGTTPTNSVFNAEYPTVRWLEMNGFDVSYISGVDTDRSGATLLNAKDHKAFLSVGHDEYWSGAQRANVEAARDAGMHLAFFSGNEVFWKTRWEASIDGSGTAHRTLVSYKETHANAKIDPAGAAMWTGTWRDPRFSPPADGGRPENALTGTIFTVQCCQGQYPSIVVPPAAATHRFWRNSPIAAGGGGVLGPVVSGVNAASGGILGYEFDEDLDNGFRPAGLAQLSSTAATVDEKVRDYGNVYGSGTATHSLTIYRHASGALVFGAGTIQWSWGLDNNHDRQPDGVTDYTNQSVQQSMVNLFGDMGAQPVTLQAGLTPATPSADVVPPSSTITSPAAGSSVASGATVTISGTATDTNGAVAGVEVSTDGGATWHPANGRQSWTYSWLVNGIGAVSLRSRATDDSGNMEVPTTATSVTITCPCSIWNPAITTPSTVDANDPSSVELGLKFRADANGFITGVRFYKSALNTGTHVGKVYSSTGTLLGSATFQSETASGWQQVVFGTPVAVIANATYVASYHTTSGHYSASGGYFASAGVDAPPLHALSNVTSLNGVYNYGGGGFPTASFNATNYWVDVIFNTFVGEGDTTPPTVTAVTPASGATGVGSGVNPTITFSEPVAPATISTSTIELRDASNAQVAGAVSYDAASRTATFSPAAALLPLATYTISARGGSSGPRVTDIVGNALASTFTSSFTTAAAVACPCSIWDPASASPAIADTGDGNAVELGVKFRAEADGFIAGLRYYKSAANGGTHLANLWSASGALLASTTFIGETASGWQEATFSVPVAITANTTYVASYHTNTGHYSVSGGYFASVGVDTPPLHALASPTSANGVFLYGASGFPTGSYNATNYWVDVVFNTSGGSDTTAPAVVSKSPAAGATGISTGSTVTATFSEAIAPATVTTSTFELRNASNTLVTATVGYGVATRTATLTPSAALAANMVYTARLRGGATDPRIKDLAGNALAADLTWSFTTAAPGSCPCSLWGSPTIGVADAGDPSEVELGVKFRTDVAGVITGIRYYKSAANSGVHIGSLWSESGAKLATATFANETATGWQAVLFTTPVAVSANTIYVASYHTTTGHYAATAGYFLSGLDAPPLHAIANGTSPNGVYQYGASAFPSSSFNSTNYWVDVVFNTGGGADTTPPTVTSTVPANGAKSIAISASVTAAFGEALTASTVTTSTFELRDPLNNVLGANVSYDAAAGIATLAPTAALQPETTYTARLVGGATDPRIKDAAGNALAADYLWSFTTASLPTGFVDTLPADFSRGALDASGYIAETADGEVTLAPTVGAEFSGSALPAGWSMSTWAGNSAATVGGGTMKVDGALAGTSAQFAAGRSLEFIATFSGAPYQHAGFAVTFAEGLWAMFSSSGGDGLYARTNNGSTATNTAIPGSWFGTPHRFRIDWSASRVDYSIDGVPVATHNIAIGATMRPVASDYDGDGNPLTIDWMRVTPYTSTSTYLSAIFDAAGITTWTSAAWSGSTPAGTSVELAVRTGDSPLPDASWSGFIVVNGPIDVTAQYLQYRLRLTTTAAGQTPAVNDVTLVLKR